MTSEEKKTLRRIWGRGKGYKDLVACDLSQKGYEDLIEQYRERDLVGPWYNQKKRMWYVEKWASVESGVANCTRHWAGDLDIFLDVDAEVEKIEERSNLCIQKLA